MAAVRPLRRLGFRSIFISDVHLGFKGCQAGMLLDFLHSTRCEHLFLVGDIIDVWNMRNGLYWPQAHNDVIRTILGRAERGTRVVSVPGNHDEVFREYDGTVFGNLSIHREFVHETADGRRLLLLHGDEFDGVVQCSPWLAHLGAGAYAVLLRLNRYVRLRAPIPEDVSYRFLRWFHRPAAATLVPTPAIRRQLEARGFGSVVLRGRGVDTGLFDPARRVVLDGERPILMYMGRVAVEKNIEAFLDLDLPGTRYVVGDGPALAALRGRYPDVVFTGARYGEELAATLAGADVFVFPSRTDTFGLVLLEAMASGVPVAAYPVEGPADVVRDGVTGALDLDLGHAVTRALALDRRACRAEALTRTWAAAAAEFAGRLVRARPEAGPLPTLIPAASARPHA